MNSLGKWVCTLGIVSILITGCAQQQAAAPADARHQTQRSGDLIEGKARVTAEIKSIQGNEVTIEILTPKEGQRTENRAGSQQDRSNQGNQQNQQRTLAGGLGGGHGGMPPGGGFGGRGSSVDTDQIKDAMKERYETTGETQTLLLPIGAPIRKMGAQEELEISDLTKGSYITLIYGDENKESIIGIQVLF